jgi:hypothetical protein
VLQFSTTRWISGDPGFTGWLSTLRHRWENRYSYAIRLMCHSPFSHIDFVLPNDDTMPAKWRCGLLGASSMGDGTPCIEGNPNGVAIRPWNYEEFGYRRRMILKTDLADRIYARAATQLGKPFDNGALKDFLSSKFPGARDWRDTGKWFCAEFGVWCEEQEGYFAPELAAWAPDWYDNTTVGQLAWPKNRISPTDMLMLHVVDPRWVNRETFWEPIPDLPLERWET